MTTRLQRVSTRTPKKITVTVHCPACRALRRCQSVGTPTLDGGKRQEVVRCTEMPPSESGHSGGGRRHGHARAAADAHGRTAPVRSVELMVARPGLNQPGCTVPVVTVMTVVACSKSR
jgi:hypothetical protein